VAIILIAVALVLLLCGALACGVGAFMLINAGPDFEETSTQADVHFDAAYYLIEDNIDGYYNEFEYIFEDAAAGENEDAASQYVDILDSANADIATARNELAEAEGLIATLDESEFKGRYLDAIALMYRSLDTYDQLYAGMPQKSGDMASVHILLENLQDADDELSESVRDVNKGDYAEAKAEANAALAIYQDAAAYFEDLAVRYPELEFDLQVTIEQEYVRAAIAAVKAAEAGLAEDNAAYQKHVAEYDAADAALEAATSPFWIDDWDLLWEEEFLAWDEAWALAEESWEAREAAWLAADEGNY
jgi:hypothetical protein